MFDLKKKKNRVASRDKKQPPLFLHHLFMTLTEQGEKIQSVSEIQLGFQAGGPVWYPSTGTFIFIKYIYRGVEQLLFLPHDGNKSVTSHT